MLGGRQLSAESITIDLQTSCGLQISSRTVLENFMEWVSMAELLHPSHTSPSAMQSAGCSGVKHAATGLQSSGDAFSGMTNHASPSGNLMEESGFGGCQENGTCLTALCQV